MIFGIAAAVSMVAQMVVGDAVTHTLMRRDSKAERMKSADMTSAFMEREMARAMFRYAGGSSKSDIARRAAQGSAGLINLFDDSQYIAKVNVGSPSQEFNVIVDTGSSDFWLAEKCRNCNGQATLFNPDDSSSLQESQQTFTIQYGSGAAQGNLVQDTIGIAGFSLSKQIFGSVSQSVGVVSAEVSGIMGAAFKTLAQTRTTPPLQALAESGKLNEPVIAFALTRSNDNDGNTNSRSAQAQFGGVMNVGFTNSSLFSGQLKMNKLSGPQSFWLVQMDDVYVDGKASNAGSKLVAIDTGTSLIGGPQNSVENVYKQIDGAKSVQQGGSQAAQGYFSIPCNTQSKVELSFGGNKFAMNPEDLMAGKLQDGSCLGSFFSMGTGTLTNGPQWVVGDSFLKNVYAAFQYGNNAAVGFAPLNTGSLATESGLSTAAFSGVTQTSTSSGISGISGIPSGASSVRAYLFSAIGVVAAGIAAVIM